MNEWIKTIFRHPTQQGGVWYSCAVAGKDQEQNKSYEYWPVDFPQGTEIPDRAKVEFKDFFISYYTRHDGTVQHKFVVRDYLITEYASTNGVAPNQAAGYTQQQVPPGYQRQPMAVGPGGYSQHYGSTPAPRQPYGQQTQEQAAEFEQLNGDVPF